MHVLVCCKEPDRAQPLLQLLAQLSLSGPTAITLLTVVGKRQAVTPAEPPRLPALPWPVRPKIRRGPVVPEILAEIEEAGDLGLVVCGWRSPRASLGSTAKRLFRACPTDLLLARPSAGGLGRALICTGGETPSLATLRSAAGILDTGEIEVSILHVMSQVAFSNASPHADLVDSAEPAMQRGTREGMHLRQAIEVFASEGYRGEVLPVLRHGLVADEAVAELHEGGYDLLVIGSLPPGRARRWSDLLLEDVGAEIAWRAPCSVLVIRPEPSSTSR